MTPQTSPLKLPSPMHLLRHQNVTIHLKRESAEIERFVMVKVSGCGDVYAGSHLNGFTA